MPIIVQVDGLAQFRKALKAAAPDMDAALKKALRAAVAPIVADAKARLSSLGGSVPNQTAKQVRGSVIRNGVAVELVQKGGFEFAREFGAKGYRVSHYSMKTRRGERQVTRAFKYASPHVFDTWTGNRFTLDSGVSGRGLFPAAAAGGQRAVNEVWAAIDKIMKQLGD